MQDWLHARAQATPDKIALVTHPAPDASSELTFRHLDQQVSAMCGRWIAAGIQPGVHVGMIMPAFPLSIVQIFTAMRMGVVLVPINTRLTADEVSQQLDNADCAWVLPYGTAEILRGLRERGHTIVNLEQRVKKRYTATPGEIDLDAPFAIVHTSGTSGVPKGAVLTYGNFFYSAMASAYRLGTLPDDRWLCVLPLYHVGGISIILRACLYGITVDLYERFEVEAVNHALTHDDVTLISLVPTMLYRLLEARQQPWSSRLRLVLLGGAAASAPLLQQCIEQHIPVATTYGLSEATSQVATALPQTAMHKPGTVGKGLSFTQIRVVNEQGNDQPKGDYGEVIVKGPTVMQGYYNNPEATARTLRDGWLYTGDIGYMDADGDLHIVQRRSDLIVTGGENVYPAEVEATLRQHPAIKEAVVIGLEDAEWGQKVAAAIQLQRGADLTETEIDAYSRERLAGYKIPRIIRFVDDFPQTASGKIERKSIDTLFD